MERASRRKYHYIYKTICIITNKFYIGMHSTDNLDDGYVGSGKRLWYSINKHGKENHICEILEFLESRELLKERERELVNEDLLNDSKCMNLKLGGEGGNGWYNEYHKQVNLKAFQSAAQNKLKELWMDEGWRNNRSLKMIEIWKNEDYAIKIKNVLNWSGKSHTEETKKKISKTNSIKQKGSNNSQYGKCWITNDIENQKIYKGDLIPEGWRLGRKM